MDCGNCLRSPRNSDGTTAAPLVIAVAAEGDTGVGAANPRIASQAPIEQRSKASRMRGSKLPDPESGIFRNMLRAVERHKLLRETQQK
jgi:hypothetical protein